MEKRPQAKDEGPEPELTLDFLESPARNPAGPAMWENFLFYKMQVIGRKRVI